MAEVSKYRVCRERRCRGDLECVKISRLRATGVVTEAMTEIAVRLGDVEAVVGLWHMHFPNGGGWSYFLCPACGQKAQRLWLLSGAIVCRRCCIRRGVRPRGDSLSVRQRAELRAPELKARLSSDKSERLKPHLWGRQERRGRLEAALRKAEFRVAQLRVPRKKVEATIDPCEEPDFVAPKPRPLRRG